jgi:hypothetical protein
MTVKDHGFEHPSWRDLACSSRALGLLRYLFHKVIKERECRQVSSGAVALYGFHFPVRFWCCQSESGAYLTGNPTLPFEPRTTSSIIFKAKHQDRPFLVLIACPI